MIIDTENLEPGVYAIDLRLTNKPLVKIDWQQGWFWEPEWLLGEIECDKEDEEIKNGNKQSIQFDTIEEFLEDLFNEIPKK